MLKQIIKIIRLLGLRRAIRMKRNHELGLAYVRGYVAVQCWLTLLRNGFLESLTDHTPLLALRNHCQHISVSIGNR